MGLDYLDIHNINRAQLIRFPRFISYDFQQEKLKSTTNTS